MIYRLLYRLLHDAPDIRNRVGTRIFSHNAPAGTKGECIILRRISGTVNSHLTNEATLAQSTMQIDFYAKTARDAESGGELVRMLLSGYQRSAVSVLNLQGTETSVTLDACNLLRPGEVVDEPRDGSDQWSYRSIADYELFYSQDVPTHA